MGRVNVAVDLGGTRLRVALADAHLQLTQRREEPTFLTGGPGGVMDQIMALSGSALAIAGVGWRSVDRLVVASPGPLDARTGVVSSPPNLPGWKEVPLKAELEERTGVRCLVVNDANAAGLGEFHFGAGRGRRNLVYLTVSTGIGGGVVVDGALLEGTSGTGGELGHTTIDLHGPRCKCGNIGCLEVLASGTAIAERFVARYTAGEPSTLSEDAARSMTATEIAEAGAAGDPLAASVWSDAMRALGFGVVNCLHTFNPDVVAIGGGVTRAGALLFDPIHEIVERYALPIPRRVTRIVPTQLGEDAGLMGAAALARDAPARGEH